METLLVCTYRLLSIIDEIAGTRQAFSDRPSRIRSLAPAPGSESVLAITGVYPKGRAACIPAARCSTKTVTKNWKFLLLALPLLFLVACSSSGDDGVATGDTEDTTSNPTSTLPAVRIASAEVLEGDAGTTDLVFTVSLDAAASGAVRMRYASSDVTAEAGLDYTPATGTLTIPAGNTSASIVVQVSGDTDPEADETFSLNLSNLSGDARFAISSAIGTIRTDELPSVAVAPASIDEGNSASRSLVFNVTLNAPTLGPVTIAFQTSDTGSAAANIDYSRSTGSITIDQGNTGGTIAISIIGDSDPEPDESFQLNLTGVTGNAELDPAASTAVGTIRNDDTGTGGSSRRVTISSAAVREGAANTQTNLVFNVDISPVDSSNPITLDYATEAVQNGATAGSDYTAIASETLTIPAGAGSATIIVVVNGDDLQENDEALNLSLSGISANATLATPIASGLIIDDDGPNATLPRVNITGASLLEGDTGTTDMLFTVTLTEPVNADVTVQFETQELAFPAPSAIAGTDYITTSGTVTFAANQTAATIAVPVIGEDVVENDEIFFVELLAVTTGNASLGNSFVRGTIVTDEPFSFVNISNPGVSEGNTGDTPSLDFVVSLTAPSSADVTLDYETLDGTATIADNDYISVPRTRLTIPAGQTRATIAVSVVGDDINEIDEQLTVLLSNISPNAELANAIGTGSIANDDSGIGWGLPQRLDPQQPVEVTHEAIPQAVMNTGGEAMAVWYRTVSIPTTPEQDTNPSSRYSPGVGWGPIEAPPGLLFTSTRSFGLNIDGSGNSFLLRDTPFTAIERHQPGSGWVEVTETADILQAAYPDITSCCSLIQMISTHRDQVMLIGLADRLVGGATVQSIVFTRYDPVTGWATTDVPAPLEETRTDIQIAVADNGHAILIAPLRRFEGVSVARHYDPVSGQWTESPPLTLQFAPGDHDGMRLLRVAMDPNGNAVAVWKGDASRDLWANRYDAGLGTWSGPTLLFDVVNSADEESPQVATDAGGNAFAIWLENNTGTAHAIRARRFDAVSGWQDIKLVADAGLDFRTIRLGGSRAFLSGWDQPSLAVDDTGSAIVVWSQDVDGDGSFTIRASRYDAGAWGPPEPISDDAMGDASMVRLTADAGGNAIAVWHQQDAIDSAFKVWTNRFVAP